MDISYLNNLIKETASKIQIKTAATIPVLKDTDKQVFTKKDITPSPESNSTNPTVVEEEDDEDNIKPETPADLGYQDAESEGPKTKVGVQSLLSASKKLLDINKGLAGPDERDALQNTRILNVDDLISERIKLDAGKLRNSLLYKLSKTKSFKNLSSGYFDDYAKGHIIGNPLSAPSEEINPLMILEQSSRVTKFGPGGIGMLDALTIDSQNIHPSQFGFIDTIATPECLVYDPNYQVLTKDGFKSIKEITEDSEIACSINGNLEFHKPNKIVYQDYSGEIYGIKTKFIKQEVTPNHRVYFQKDIFNSIWQTSEIKQLFRQDLIFCGDKDKVTSSKANIIVSKDNHYKYNYIGKVWCLQVPGSLFYMRYGDEGTAYWTGNSAKAGADVRLTYNSRLGKKDGKIYTRVREKKTGKLVWMTPDELQQHTVGIPQ